MNQKRRSFLQRAVSVLLAPLGIIPAMKFVKPGVYATTITFPDNTQLSFSGKLTYRLRCDAIRDGCTVKIDFPKQITVPAGKGWTITYTNAEKFGPAFRKALSKQKKMSVPVVYVASFEGKVVHRDTIRIFTDKNGAIHLEG